MPRADNASENQMLDVGPNSSQHRARKHRRLLQVGKGIGEYRADWLMDKVVSEPD
jgi:hypothetical protein